MNNLKMMRKKRGLTVRQLAEKIHTSASYISQLENGHRDISTIRQSTRDRLCEALTCVFSDIYEDESVFEYRNNKLICDEIYICRERRMPPAIIRIKNAYYHLPEQVDKKKPLHLQLTKHSGAMVSRIRLVLLASKNVDVRRFAFAYLNLTLRKPFKIKVGRAITSEEWEEFNLSSGECSGEIKSLVGREYGLETEVIIKVRQVVITDEVADALKKRGIHIERVDGNYYNIRTA